jgi:hypothetical protein
MTMNVSKDVWIKEPSNTTGGNVREYNHYRKQYGGSLNTKNRSAIRPSNITPRDTYLKDCDPAYNISTCTPRFITALFTITKLWKQQKCPNDER